MNDYITPKSWPAQERLPHRSTGVFSEIKGRLDALPKGAVLYCVHSGNSMKPTLLSLDLLEIVPCGEIPVEVGDVVFFQPNGRELPVIHRISHITSESIRTIGDNNACADNWLLQTSDILGRVVAAWRGQKRHAIAGGKTGALIYSFSRVKRIVDRTLSSTLAPLYHCLSHRSIIQSLLPNRLKPRIVAFQINGKKQLKLMMNRRQVGYYDTQQKRWNIRRPFRLLIDAYTLTTPNQLNFE